MGGARPENVEKDPGGDQKEVRPLFPTFGTPELRPLSAASPAVPRFAAPGSSGRIRG